MTGKIAALLVLLLVLSPAAEARQRAVAFRNVPDATTVPGWLMSYTYPLTAIDRVPWSSDLDMLRHLIGNATVVGLGDATHGTREFYTVKLRLIEYLVREMNFDVIAFEGAVPHFDELNAYILGAPGDPRMLLEWSAGTLQYFFWDVEEMVPVLEFLREYNAHRGSRPPVLISGTDLYGQVDAWNNVVAYLRTVDPAMAATAEGEYACIGTDNFKREACFDHATRVHDALAGKATDFIARSSRDAYYSALLNARVVVQMQHWDPGVQRDRTMAENVEFIAHHRSTTGKVVYWGHNGHVNETPMEFSSEKPAGQFLHEALGDRYFTIGTLTGGGTFLQWPVQGNKLTRGIGTWPPLAEGMVETFLRQRGGTSAYLIPLDQALPEWLSAPRLHNSAGNSGQRLSKPYSLPAMFDAVIYIETTTPLQPLRPLPPS